MAVGISFDSPGRKAVDRVKDRVSFRRSEEALMDMYLECADLHDKVRSQMSGRAEGGEDRLFYCRSRRLRRDVSRKCGAEIYSFSHQNIYVGRCTAKTVIANP